MISAVRKWGAAHSARTQLRTAIAAFEGPCFHGYPLAPTSKQLRLPLDTPRGQLLEQPLPLFCLQLVLEAVLRDHAPRPKKALSILRRV